MSRLFCLFILTSCFFSPLAISVERKAVRKPGSAAPQNSREIGQLIVASCFEPHSKSVDKDPVYKTKSTADERRAHFFESHSHIDMKNCVWSVFSSRGVGDYKTQLDSYNYALKTYFGEPT